MTQQQSPPPIVFIFLGLAIISGIYWMMTGKKSDSPAPQGQISLGNKLLIKTDATPEKQMGIQAFAARNFAIAIKQFRLSLLENRNDPETSIYLNNSNIAEAGGSGFEIAVSVPISSNPNIAQEILRGVAQAQNEVNQDGGINGKGLQVGIIDDGNNPEIAKQIAVELVKEDSQVLAVVGHNASEATLSAAPVYQQGHLVMITPTSFADSLSDYGSYIFRTVPAIRFMAEPLAQYAVKTKHKTHIAVCYDSHAQDNRSFKDEFVAALEEKGGKQVPVDCDFSSPTFDPDTVIYQAISSGAEGLLLAPYIDRLELAIKVARANKGRLPLFGSPTLYTIKTLQLGQDDVNGLTLVAPWCPTAFPTDPFTANAFKRWGGAVNWRTAMAYDATRAIIAGLQQSNTRVGLQQVLRSRGFSVSGAGEKVKFLPTGDRSSLPILIQVKPRSSGQDFIPLRP